MNKPPPQGVGTDPVAYTVSGNGKFVIPLTAMTIFILFGMGALVIGSMATAWLCVLIFGSWGIIAWKTAVFLSLAAYFLVIRPYRKARG